MAAVLAYTTQSHTITTYAEPTFDEMIGLCIDFELVEDVRRGVSGLVLQVTGDWVEMDAEAAAVFLKGLLLGYFHRQRRDDLSLAEWHS